MKKTRLQFSDILHLLEFVEHTNLYHCHVDVKSKIIACEFTEADIELAIRGFNARLLNDAI